MENDNENSYTESREGTPCKKKRNYPSMAAAVLGAVMPFKCNGEVHRLLARRTASFSPCSSRSPDDISGMDGGRAIEFAYMSSTVQLEMCI